MSRASLERVVSLLGELTASELEQVRAKVAALRALSGPAALTPREAAGPVAIDHFPSLLHGRLSAALLARNAAPPPPWEVFVRTRDGAAFQKAAAAAGELHAQWFPKESRVQTAALCDVYAVALLGWLEERGQGFGPHRLTYAVANFQEAIERSFPGYVRSGLLSMAFNRQRQS